MKQITALSIVFFSSVLSLFSQDFSSFIPASPEAEAMKEYIDIPVNEYSGIPNIGIPLTSISDNGINVPITLSYHAGGIKVAEEASWVGLGWNLNAGGMITREIRDKDDFEFFDQTEGKTFHGFVRKMLDDPNFVSTFPNGASVGGTYTEIEKIKNTNLATIKLQFSTPDGSYTDFADQSQTYGDMFCNTDTIDLESDVYNYSLGGYAGKFVMNHEGEFVTLSDHNLIIEIDSIDFSWTITTPDGNKYYFGTNDNSKQITYSQSFGYTTPLESDPLVCTNCDYVLENQDISTWFLDKIVSKSGGEINFSYTKDIRGLKPIPNFSETLSKVIQGCSVICYDKDPFKEFNDIEYKVSVNRITYDNVYLNTITNSKNQFLYFMPSPFAREDLIDGKILSKIISSTQSGANQFTHLQTIKFAYDYFISSETNEDNLWQNMLPYYNPGFQIWEDRIDDNLGNNLKRLKLKEVEICDKYDNCLPPYAFKYNKLTLPPKTSFSTDYWGFSNASARHFNKTYIPKGIFVSTSSSSLETYLDNYTSCPTYCSDLCTELVIDKAEKSSNEIPMKASVLEGITFPLGGKVDFEMEMHTFDPYVPANGLEVTEQSSHEELHVPGSYYVDHFEVFAHEGCRPVIVTMDIFFDPAEQTCSNVPLYKSEALFTNLNGSSETYILGLTGDVNNGVLHINEEIILPEGEYLIQFIPNSVYEDCIVPGSDSYIHIEFDHTGFEYNSIEEGGGLRIAKKITDDNNGNVLTTVFNYNKSGELFSTPLYYDNSIASVSDIFVSNGLNFIFQQYVNVYSNSLKSLVNSFASGVVGYSTVTKLIYGEDDGGGQVYKGKINSTYKNDLSDVDPAFKSFNLGLPHFINNNNGAILTSDIYNASSSKVSSNTYNYSNDWEDLDWVWSTRIKKSGVGFLYSPCSSDANSPYIFESMFYSFVPQWHKLLTVTESSWGTDGSGPLTSTTTNTYYTHNYSIATSALSDGTTTKTTSYKYADDLNVSFLEDANMVTIPLERRINDGTGGGAKLDYVQLGQMIVPKKYYTSEDSIWKLRQELFYDDSTDSYPDEIQRNTESQKETLTWGTGYKVGLLESRQYGSRTWDYEYNDKRLIESITDHSGIESEFVYDGFNRLKNSETNNGRQTTNNVYTYGMSLGGSNSIYTTQSFLNTDYTIPAINVSQLLDGMGRAFVSYRYQYTFNGNDYKTSMVYDNMGQVIEEIDPGSGGVTKHKYELSPLNRRIETIPAGSPNPILFKHGVDGPNKRFGIETTDENGNKVIRFTDIFGRNVGEKRFNGTEELLTTYQYNDRDQITSITPPGGSTPYTYTYLDDGLLSTKTIPDQGTYTYTYTALDQVLTESLPNGNVLTYEYDTTYSDFLRKVKIGTEVIKEFWQEGVTGWVDEEEIQATLEDGTKQMLLTEYTYDDIGRIVEESRETVDGEIASEFVYDDLNNLRQEIKTVTGPDDTPVEIITEYEYPKGIRLTSTSMEINGEEVSINELSYDDRDWLTSRIIGDGIQSLSYGYNPRGWLTKINSVQATFGNTNPCEPDIPCPPGKRCNDPPPVPCDDPSVVLQVIIAYNCNKIRKEQATAVNVYINKQDTTNGEWLGNANHKYSLPLNGFIEGYETEITDFDTLYFVGPVDISDLSDGIIGIVSNCMPFQQYDSNIQFSQIESGMEAALGTLPEAGAGGTLFGMEIHYFDGNSTLNAADQYNGNISWMQWRVQGGGTHQYGFTYDGVDRLLNAQYGSLPDNCNRVIDNKYNVAISGYDPRGNISSLTRKGLVDIVNDVPVYGTVDSLSYSYTGSNLLSSITENGNTNHGFLASSSSYGYSTGNLTSDSGKGMSGVAYNYLNLPTSVPTSNGTMKVVYDANGNKHKQLITGTSDSVTYNYIGGVEYKDGEIEAIYHDEGRYVYDDEESTEYHEWVIRDHLGNTRVRFADLDENGDIEVNDSLPNEDELLGEYHYYPFGMEWEGDWQTDSSGVKNKYRYNGKEFTDNAGLNWYSYGARWYDPAVGRFTSIDPISDQFPHVSTFNYAENEPIANVDLHGLQAAKGYLAEGLGRWFRAGATVIDNIRAKLSFTSKRNVTKENVGPFTIENSLNNKESSTFHSNFAQLFDPASYNSSEGKLILADPIIEIESQSNSSAETKVSVRSGVKRASISKKQNVQDDGSSITLEAGASAGDATLSIYNSTSKSENGEVSSQTGIKATFKKQEDVNKTSTSVSISIFYNNEEND